MTYEFNGEEYAKASAHQKEWGARLIRGLHLEGDERVLDRGCGDGELTAQLALRVPHGSVLGIDAPEGMIAAAGGRPVLRDLPAHQRLCAQVTTLPAPRDFTDATPPCELGQQFVSWIEVVTG